MDVQAGVLGGHLSQAAGECLGLGTQGGPCPLLDSLHHCNQGGCLSNWSEPTVALVIGGLGHGPAVGQPWLVLLGWQSWAR